MGWLKDHFTAEPIECPRGWGEVTFAQDFEFFPVFFSIQQRCPIGGVESCAKCLHPLNPGLVEQLRLQLAELDELRGTTLTEAEFQVRRRLVVEAWEPFKGTPGRGTAIAALILGPLGLLTMGAGWYLSAVVHIGFLGLAGGGLVLTSIAASLAAISHMQRRRLSDGPDLAIEELPDRTYEIEAELGRAREELRFFRELHDGGAPGDSSSTEGTDS